MKFYLPTLVICFFIFSSCRASGGRHIYINAKIWTGDSANPEAKAIAIRDSMIFMSEMITSHMQATRQSSSIFRRK